MLEYPVETVLSLEAEENARDAHCNSSSQWITKKWWIAAAKCLGMSSFCLNWHLKQQLVSFYLFQDKICSGSHVVRCNSARTSILPLNIHHHSVVYHSSSKHGHENVSLQSDISLLNIRVFHKDVKTQKEKQGVEGKKQ